MGGFFLYHQNSDINPEASRNIFQSRQFKPPNQFDLGEYQLHLYEKILLPYKNYFKQAGNMIFGTGTFNYKGEIPEVALVRLLTDQIKGKLDKEELLGHFCILFYIQGRISILLDPTGIYNVFYNSEYSVFTSSFLAITASHKRKLDFNRLSLTEILVTGSLIGPDTMLNGISRLEINTSPHLNGVRLLNDRFIPYQPVRMTYTDCLNEQLMRLDKYFNCFTEMANKNQADAGLTGGFDSRLLMIIGLKHFRNIKFHSHWRNYRSDELEVAKLLVAKAGQELDLVKVTDTIDMTPEIFKEVLWESCLFYDGTIRMHCNWNEEYNTLQYRKKILRGYGMGLHGIGGEQFRNQERMLRNTWDFSKWLKYDILMRYSGNCFREGKDLRNLATHLEIKIRQLLDTNRRNISHFEVKRYLNEIYIPANRGSRTNAENSISFFLSPFADPYISMPAYNAVPHLGLSNRFQTDLIRISNPELALIESDYGYNFIKGEGLFSRMQTPLKELLPKKYYSWFLHNFIKHDKSDWLNQVTHKFPSAATYLARVKNLDLPIEIASIMDKSDLAPQILSIGFFMEWVENGFQISD